MGKERVGTGTIRRADETMILLAIVYLLCAAYLLEEVARAPLVLEDDPWLRTAR